MALVKSVSKILRVKAGYANIYGLVVPPYDHNHALAAGDFLREDDGEWEKYFGNGQGKEEVFFFFRWQISHNQYHGVFRNNLEDMPEHTPQVGDIYFVIENHINARIPDGSRLAKYGDTFEVAEVGEFDDLCYRVAGTPSGFNVISSSDIAWVPPDIPTVVQCTCASSHLFAFGCTCGYLQATKQP